MKGQFAFKGLKPAMMETPRGMVFDEGYKLTEYFYFSKEDCIRNCGADVIWPVEILDNGVIYIPSEDEVKELFEKETR